VQKLGTTQPHLAASAYTARTDSRPLTSGTIPFLPHDFDTFGIETDYIGSVVAAVSDGDNAFGERGYIRIVGPM